MRIIGVIPARMASTRFPGKPLAKICGIPMLGHVYFRSKMSKVLHSVYIATCDKEIEGYGRSIGAEVIMTKDTHQRASDRTAEAMFKIEKATREKSDIVVMIQGDEPMLFPEMIDISVQPMIKDKTIKVVNLAARIEDYNEHSDINTVKVVFDQDGFALYFSREPIPFSRNGAENLPIFKQVPIIPFRRDLLIKFNKLHQSQLEIAESIDMLRLLEHGYKVKMSISEFKTYAVDTKEDLKKVERFMQNDILRRRYTRDI